MQNLFNLQEFSFPDLIDLDKPWLSLQRIEEYIKSKREELLSSGFKEFGQALVHREAKVNNSATIDGPAIIDSGTEVRDVVLLRGGVIIGKNCKIGHATEVKHSIFLNNASAGHFNYVGDSILGRDTNLGAGAILANFKSSSKNPTISVNIGNKAVDTQLRKLGALVADGVKIGSNTVTAPGTIIGANSVLYPLTFVRGTIAANKIIKNKSDLEIVDQE